MGKKSIKKSIKDNFEGIVDAFLLISILLFLLYHFKPEFLFSKTTIAGGDMVSHFVLLHYLKNYLMPHGKLIGWYPHWLCGLPMFQFYFIPPYLAMSLLSYLIPLEISFKLISVLGIFLLPFTTYWSMKLMEFKFPTPIVASILSLMFLFLETNSYYGGNIPSTLAGEISYSISFSLMILFFGLLYKGVKTEKYFISNTLLLTLVVLTHVYTSILMFLVSSFFILTKKLEGLRYLVSIGVLSFFLVAFWLLPFIFKFNYSAAPKELLSQVDISLIFIPHYTVFYLLASLSALIGIKNRDLKILYICFTILIALILFLFANKVLNLLYIRFAPFLYFFPLLLAADGLEKISLKLKKIIPLILFLIILIWLIKNVSYIPYWIKWNYEGLEGKSTWSEFKNVLDEIKKLNESGRIIVEYSTAYDKYGSPRVFEVSPVFTNKSVMEGLLLESSLTFPFYYYIQKEIAETTWWPGFPIKYPDFNLTSGAEHLRLFNVKYYLVSSEKIKEEIKKNKNYRFLKSVHGFEFYSLNEDSRYVELSKNEPVLVLTDDWKSLSYEWFGSNFLNVPLVFVSGNDINDFNHFRIVVVNKSIEVPKGKLVFNNIYEAMKESKTVEQDCNITETVSEEEIEIETNCIDKPVIIKVPYFPNWKVSGAEKIYLSSPNLMMIFPKENRVKLYYGNTGVDIVSTLLSLIGSFCLVVIILRNLMKKFS